MMGAEIVPEDIAASFQQSVVEVLVSKTIKAAKAHGVKKIALAEGLPPTVPCGQGCRRHVKGMAFI